MTKALALAAICLLSMNALAQSKNAKPALHSAPARTSMKVKTASASTKKARPLSESIYVYNEGGWTKYRGNAHSLGELYKELGINGRTWVTTPDCGVKGKNNGCNVMIGYKLFTNQPQWALMNDTLGLHRYVSRFDLEKVIASRLFEFEAGLQIEEHTVNSAFLIETLGPPDRKREDYIENNSENELWDYDRYALAFTLQKGVAVKCTKLED